MQRIVMTLAIACMAMLLASPALAQTAVIVGGPYAGETNADVTFDGTGSAGDAYEWDFGDGTTSTDLVATHAYLLQGNYTATLTAITYEDIFADPLVVASTDSAMVAVAITSASTTWTPANQYIGFYDTEHGSATEEDCRGCHGDTLANTHHLLYGSAVKDPSMAPNPDPAGIYTCLSCHDETFTPERDCTECHKTDVAGIHHGSTLASSGNCQFCHGYVVKWGSVAPPAYAPSLITPSRTGEHDALGGSDDGNAEPSFTFDSGEHNYTGRGAQLYYYGEKTVGPGGCDYCHNAIVEVPATYAPIAGPDGYPLVETEAEFLLDINTNYALHHHVAGSGVMPSQGCNACHTTRDDNHEFTESDGVQMRVCENCHSRGMLHNTQVASSGDPADPTTVGGEDAGFGHVGRDAGPGDSDCWGCHGFGMGGASVPADTSALVPTVYTCEPTTLTAGTATQVTVDGAVFVNTTSGVEYSSSVLLTAADGSSVTLSPDSIDGGSILATIPADLAAGKYMLQAVKTDAAGEPVTSNSVGIAIAPAVTIDSVTAANGTVTITGSGFAGYANDSVTSVKGSVTSGKGKKATTTTVTAKIVGWSDTEIKVVFDSAPSDVAVTSVFGSATADIASSKPGKGGGNGKRRNK